MKKIKYNYKEFEDGVDYILNNIRAVGTTYDRVVGLARGGLPLAVRLSYELGMPLECITWSHRDFAQKEYNDIPADDMRDGQKILLVDDIIDSGLTINSLLETWGVFPKENLSIACCYYNIDQDIQPDFWHKTIERSTDDSWVDFWWETKHD
jgi:hypoxanthine phosphoribosyltransferase